MDNEIPETEHIAKDEAGALSRSYHQLFMDKLRKRALSDSDRF